NISIMHWIYAIAKRDIGLAARLVQKSAAQKESGQEHEMDVNEFGQIGKQKGDMQCRLSVMRTQSRIEHGKQLPTLPPATRNWTISTLVGFGVVVRRAAG